MFSKVSSLLTWVRRYMALCGPCILIPVSSWACNRFLVLSSPPLLSICTLLRQPQPHATPSKPSCSATPFLSQDGVGKSIVLGVCVYTFLSLDLLREDAFPCEYNLEWCNGVLTLHILAVNMGTSARSMVVTSLHTYMVYFYVNRKRRYTIVHSIVSFVSILRFEAD